MTTKEDEPKQGKPQDGGAEVDLAQAYRDLARGEQAAAAMEANLTNLESKLDALLAAAEKSAEEAEAAKARESKAGDKDSAGEGRGSS